MLVRYIHHDKSTKFTSDSPKNHSSLNIIATEEEEIPVTIFLSPLASRENIDIPMVFKISMKIEEDEVAMDSIPIVDLQKTIKGKRISKKREKKK